MTITKIGLIQFLLLFFVVCTAFGQEVKYQDIFRLLNAKKYEQAEPLLKKYMAENDENPNAFLFRGIIIQEKLLKNDGLKQTPLILVCIDSAVFFFDKALKSISEKEVRKNKEYYQLYKRRDLRTGDVEIKVSDIRFDIEKRIAVLKEQSKNAK